MKKLSLSIPESCEEDWDQMPINGRGRDCSKCEKNIRDFTKLSDNELIALIRTNESLCGRFLPEQLDRHLIADRKKLIPTLNLYAVAAGFGALVCFPSFGAENKRIKHSIDLIEVVSGTSTLPQQMDGNEEDTMTRIMAYDRSRQIVIPNITVMFYDDQGILVDAILSDKHGIVYYSTKTLEQYRVHEIHISTSEEYKDETIVWTPDDNQRIIVELEATEENKAPRRIMMGKVISSPSF